MGVVTDAWGWLTTGAHWTGEEGVGQRLAEHVYVSGAALLIAAALALPLGLWLGHLGKGGTLAVNVSNVGRAVPVFAVLALFMVSPCGTPGTCRPSSPWCSSRYRRSSPTRTWGCGRSTGPRCGPRGAWG